MSEAAAHAQEPQPIGFVAGLSARHDAAATALRSTVATRAPGFAPAELIRRIEHAYAQPRHFSPADRDADPTAGWNPLDATAAPNAHLDPLAAAHAAGYAEGLAAAHAAGIDPGERDGALVAQLVAELNAAGRVDRTLLAQQLRQTVTSLVGRLVGDVGISADLLAARVKAATDLLADASESAMLRVNPADVALLDGALPHTIFAVGDDTVPRGSFVMEAASTIVEDGPALWLEQLAVAIDRAALPET